MHNWGSESHRQPFYKHDKFEAKGILRKDFPKLLIESADAFRGKQDGTPQIGSPLSLWEDLRLEFAGLFGAGIEAHVLHRGRAALEAPYIVDLKGDLHTRHDQHSGYGKREGSRRFQHSLSTCQSVRTIFSPRYPIKTRCSLISRAVVVEGHGRACRAFQTDANGCLRGCPNLLSAFFRPYLPPETDERSNRNPQGPHGGLPKLRKGLGNQNTGGRRGNRSRQHRARLWLQQVRAEGFGETHSRFQAHRRRAQSRTLDRR